MNYSISHFFQNVRKYGFVDAMKEDFRQTKKDYLQDAMDSMNNGRLGGFVMMLPVWYADDFKDWMQNRRDRKNKQSGLESI
ncbi:hypothetical protein J4423_00740 [Candidatus Pacearchaeota archaeon]|nr:hypothetical protein [Candidatus Pacearchaeota archaeon]